MKHSTLRKQQLNLSKRKGKAKQWSYVASIVNPIIRNAHSAKYVGEPGIVAGKPGIVVGKPGIDLSTLQFIGHVGYFAGNYDNQSTKTTFYTYTSFDYSVAYDQLRRHKRKTNIITLLWIVGFLLYLVLVVFF